MTKVVALVAPHFPPSNLAGVHRARLLSQHLEEFGWRPIIITTHWRHYEEALDWDLVRMISPDLEIISTRAMPTRPFRIVGDIGIRGFLWHRAAIARLFSERRIDFLHITVPSFYSALLGASLYWRRPIPFGIDYIDPWVNTWPDAEKRFSKAWASLRLAELLEPIAVRDASLITGVAPGYYAGVFGRNPALLDHCAVAAMPYGNSERDFEAAIEHGKKPHLFDPADGLFHMFYAGALLPKGWTVLESLFKGLTELCSSHPDIYRRVRLHFVGTGKSPTDARGYNVLPIAQRLGVAEIVTEHPHRMAYADVLTHLMQCSAPLIVGSTEPHYTPSKVFQSIQSGRPVFALLHEESTAVSVLEQSGGGVALTLSETRLPAPEEIARKLARFITDAASFDPATVNRAAFASYSARESARLMANALNDGLATFNRRLHAPEAKLCASPS
jgi:hypothetical protein